MGLVLRPVSPAALAAGNNNDYAGIGLSSFARLTPDGGGSTITGIVAPASINDGTVIVLLNLGAGTLTIANQNANSAAANRIITETAADVAMATNEMMSIIYDGTTARWRQYTPSV